MLPRGPPKVSARLQTEPRQSLPRESRVEDLRGTSENLTKTNENLRKTYENLRKISENLRETSEDFRKTNAKEFKKDAKISPKRRILQALDLEVSTKVIKNNVFFEVLVPRPKSKKDAKASF